MRIQERDILLPEWGDAPVFHPKIALLADGGLLMIAQPIYASDSFGVPRWSLSRDGGGTWSRAWEIGALAVRPAGELENGVCDLVPLCHRQSGKVILLGQNVYYRAGRFVRSHPGLQRYGVYLVGDGRGAWEVPHRLELPELSDSPRVATGCSQFLEREDGILMVPVSYSDGGENRLVTVASFGFDGTELHFLEHGNALRNRASRRGLMEPSLVRFGGKYVLTMRAEDGFGYLSVSSDGVAFTCPSRWRWADGEPLAMSSTQQHLLELGGALYLIYTRDAGFNRQVVRFRSPLFLAQVDLDNLCLRRETETTVFPLHGNPEQPDSVGLLGNFMVTRMDETHALISDGEIFPHRGWDRPGNLRLAQIEV